MKWGAYYRQSNKTVRYKIGSRRKEAKGTYSQEHWEKLCSFFGDECPRCHNKVERFSVDHIKPLSRGGTNTIDNLQPLCLSCNVKKSNIYVTDYRPREVLEWLQSL